jgi:hypothetical protein
MAAVRRTPWVDEVTRGGDELRVIARDTAAASRDILPLVVQQGITLVRFERGRPSLEDIFLRLIGTAQDEKGVVA